MQAKSKTTVITSYPVSVANVTKSQLSETLSLVGTIAANSDVAIVSETQGRVVAINANVGDFKSSGAMLVQIDDELKKAEFIKAEVNYERAKKDAERFKSLREERAATEWQKENAWQAFKVAEAQYVRSRKEYRDTKISTPIAGIVTSRPVDVGTMVQPGMVVANVVDISKLKVRLNVAEQDAFKLKAGDPVDDMIRQIRPYLTRGDILIDGGNSFFQDTRRRHADLARDGILYIGSGVSGGEEGALWGPSLMPGGPKEAYAQIEPIWKKIAAQVDSSPCTTYVGPDGAGHF
ncbi:efflux RND transporter periplasmic adaptor subunit, partial [Sphingobacteriales bacterium CHB3]|nr:efflux RND transporter periplasmic adaptor subunit [Sphingobacteriales bacterium CHB3]